MLLLKTKCQDDTNKNQEVGYLSNYMSNSIQQAILQAVKSRSVYYQLAKKFNVPKSTLMWCCKDQQKKKSAGIEITYKFLSLMNSS